MRRALSVGVLLLVVSRGAAAQPAVAIAGTAAYEVRHPRSGERYELSVALPRGADAKTARPVLYVLDGTEDFPLAQAVADLVRAECELTLPPLVVGIGDGARIDAPGNRRNRDYTPTRSEVTWARGDGGAHAFLAFLEESVFPFIGARYAVTTDRALFGFSYGGLFGAYVLAERPGTFAAYLLGSPSVFYDSATVQRALSRTASAAADAPRPRVLLTAGALEDWAIEGNRDYAQALRARFGPQMVVESVTLPAVGHAMGKLDAMRLMIARTYCPPSRTRGTGGL
ncbi:MAG: alpha/beta hydrolase-fold protein [Gemmatimonadaceae bacterium]|nr:alpha/beta hydrolase-fold protein [Gemmatimonadaceae bacterium]